MSWPITVVSYKADWTDPVPLQTLGRVTGEKHSFSWPGGCHEASWSLDVPINYSHRALRPDRLVRIYDGLQLVWSGRIDEPQRAAPWSFTAQGLQAVLADYVPLSGTSATSNPNTALTGAISRGCPVTVPSTLPTPTLTTSYGDIAALLNDVASASGQRWGVFANAQVVMYADPTTPSWHGIASDTPGSRTILGYASSLYALYLNSGASGAAAIATATTNPTTVPSGLGVHEVTIDLTDRGPISSTEATAVATNTLGLYNQRAAFTGTLAMADGSILHPGGVPARMTDITSGVVMRFRGVLPDPDLGALSLSATVDIVLGDVSFDSTATPSLTIAPVDLQANDLATVLSQVETRFGLAAVSS